MLLPNLQNVGEMFNCQGSARKITIILIIYYYYLIIIITLITNI